MICSGSGWSACQDCGVDPGVQLGPENPADLDSIGRVEGFVILSGRAEHSGVTVTLSGLDGRQALTEGSGSYEFEAVPSGVYLVEAVMPGFGEGASAPFSVSSGQTQSVDGIILQPVGGSLQGVVLLEDATTHDGTVVNVVGTSAAGLTDESGRWTLSGLPEGSYSVHASHAGYVSSGLGDQNLQAGGVLSVPTLTLSRQPGFLEGHVSIDVADPSGITVIGSASWNPGTVCMGVTDRNSHYLSEPCAPGEYVVSVQVPGFESDDQTVTVVSGENRVVDFELVREHEIPAELVYVQGGGHNDDPSQMLRPREQSQLLGIRLIGDRGGQLPEIATRWTALGPEGPLQLTAGSVVSTEETGEAANAVVASRVPGPIVVEVSVIGYPELSLSFSLEQVPGLPSFVVPVRNDLVGIAGGAVPEGVSVLVYDDVLNPVPSAGVRFSAGGDPWSSDADETGVATTEWVLEREVGRQSLEADATVEGGTIATATIFATAIPQPVAELEFLDSGTDCFVTPRGRTTTFRVRALDSEGYPVEATPVAFAEVEGNLILEATELVTDGDGVAAVEGFVDGCSSVSLVATSGDAEATRCVQPSGDVASVELVHEAPIVGSEVCSDTGDGPIVGCPSVSLQFQVFGECGLPVGGADLALDAHASQLGGHGSIDAEVTTSDGDGLVSAEFVAGTLAGTRAQWVDAYVSGTSALTTHYFDVAPRAPNYVDAISGLDQHVVVAEPFPAPFVARVADEFDNPVPSVEVHWSASSDDATFMESETVGHYRSTTDQFGRAEAVGVLTTEELATFVAEVDINQAEFEVQLGGGLLSSVCPWNISRRPNQRVRVESSSDWTPRLAIRSTIPTVRMTSFPTDSDSRPWSFVVDGTDSHLEPTYGGVYLYEVAGTRRTNSLPFVIGGPGVVCDSSADCVTNLCTNSTCAPEGLIAIRGIVLDEPVGADDDRGGNVPHDPAFLVTLQHIIFMTANEVTQQEYARLIDIPVGCANCPVEVSFIDALRYANARSQREGLEACISCAEGHLDGDCESVVVSRDCEGYRLPYELEWEISARANTSTAWYCGDDPSCVERIGWCRDSEARPVGQLIPNAFGFFDMIGNSREWVLGNPFDYEPHVRPEIEAGCGPIECPPEPMPDLPIGGECDEAQCTFATDNVIYRGEGCDRVYARNSVDGTETVSGFRLMRIGRGQSDCD